MAKKSRPSRRTSTVHGVLVVDKPKGPTSHDIVGRVRRAVGTRTVGHAGTLDPMATGVLVVAIGEATKLVPYLTADDKHYDVSISLGSTTNTLDAEGETTARAPVPELSLAHWQRLADSFLGEHAQQVPKVSAVRVDGKRLHARERAGEEFEAPVRQVFGHSMEVLGIEANSLRARLHTGKGFYVRAWARDLTAKAGTVGHLTALRRTRSGQFRLPGATSFADVEAAAEDPSNRPALLGTMLSMEAACSAVMPSIRLNEEGAAYALQGRSIEASTCVPHDAPDGTLALLGPEGNALAVGCREGGVVKVVRGFRFATPQAPAP